MLALTQKYYENPKSSPGKYTSCINCQNNKLYNAQQEVNSFIRDTKQEHKNSFYKK